MTHRRRSWEIANRSREGCGAAPLAADESRSNDDKGRSGPAEHAIRRDRGVEPSTVHNRATTNLPDHSKGGELVLKLFASTEALWRGEDGQTMAEYGVILAVVTLTVVASMMILGGAIGTAFESIAGILPG